ncbi:hypothetical protein BVC93_19440 [Mycobacterium sp. MS1601]|nr:hypothetical protein BVC93_19440 [Mycobacterium sp. MS1601]
MGASLGGRLDELAQRVVTAIRAQVEFYRVTSVITDERLLADTTTNLRFVFAALEQAQVFDTTPAVTTGNARASAGVPLPSVMHAFRVASHEMWNVLIELSQNSPEISAETLLRATELFWQAQDRYTDTMVGAYRNQSMQQVLDDEAERAALAEALLEGRLSRDHSLWEVAQLLRIPADGPYIVVAASVPMIGRQALPGVASMLRSIDVFSAWRLLPDVQIGIARVPTDDIHDATIGLLERISTSRVGVSPRFDDLADTAQALRFAHSARAARRRGENKVALFENSVLGVAAISAPEVATKLATVVLGGFDDLPPMEREVLFDTFRVWAEVGGSVQEAAARLVCHPNTVRYRLKRIEERAARSLSVPRDLAELCLAFEIVDRGH